MRRSAKATQAAKTTQPSEPACSATCASSSTSFGRLTLLLGLGSDDLGAARNLQRLLLAHALSVCWKIPQIWRCKTGVALLDAHLFVDALLQLLDLVLDALERGSVWTLTVGLEELDIALI